MFVKIFGNYLLHAGVESHKAAMQYQEHCSSLGCEPLTPRELAHFKSGYDKLKARFGKNYLKDYGWAAATLKKDSPTFRDIEESVGLDRLRPFYRMANQNVHA